MKSNQPVEDGQKTSEVETVRVLLGTIGDTTWRMFVPTLPLIMLGNWLDSTYATKPLFLIMGATLGGLLAALLIRAQLRRKL